MDLIRQYDLYGIPTNLTFNNKGAKHKTMCGGLASLIVKGLMIVYILNLLMKLVQYEAN